MCSGAILLYGIPHVVIGDSVNFKGPEEYLRSRGVKVVSYVGWSLFVIYKSVALDFVALIFLLYEIMVLVFAEWTHIWLCVHCCYLGSFE